MTILKTLIINDHTDPNSSVIWLHGLGADGHDFAPVVEILDMPQTRFVLPHAPLKAVTLNHGYIMPAWYDIYGLDRDSKQDETGIRETQAAINQLIETEHQKGIPYNRIALAGFSQGGAIALHTGLRFSHPLAGIAALSTYLPLKNLLRREAAIANKHIQIYMAHGKFDDIITMATAINSAEVLSQNGYQVQWKEYAMPHSVCDEEINDIRVFLQSIFTKS